MGWGLGQRCFDKKQRKAKHQGKRWECPGKRQREGKQRQRESGQLALQDGKVEDEEEEGAPEEEAKRARDPCASVLADATDALEEAEKKKRLTKESKTDTLAMLEELKHHEKILKQILVKRESNMKLQKAKEAIANAAHSIKKCKDEAKEWRALANKAGSKASSKRK